MGCLGRRRLLYRLVGVALHMPQDNKGSLFVGPVFLCGGTPIILWAVVVGCLGLRRLLYRLVCVALQVQKATNSLRHPLFRYSLLTENHLL